MAQRKLTPKSLLHKANTAKSAIAFFQAYKEYLTTGELSSITMPIITRMVNAEILPTPALIEIQQAVFAHIMTSTIKKGEEQMNRVAEPKAHKNYLVTICTADGKLVKEDGEELETSFVLPQDAERWADRKLFNNSDSAYAEIVSTVGKAIKTIILRQDAIARILRKNKGPVVHQRGMSTKSLKFTGKASQDRAYFSQG